MVNNDRNLYQNLEKQGYKPNQRILTPAIISTIDSRLANGNNYKTYSKQEIADSMGMSLKTLMGKINGQPELMDELVEFGYRNNNRIFTARQIGVIVNGLVRRTGFL